MGWNNRSCTWLANFRHCRAWFVGIIPICVSSDGRVMYHFSQLPVSACASRHAPRVPCWITFIIICPAALCLLLIILVMMGGLQPDSMWQVPSNFQQMGQIGGPSICKAF
jgi:hypothetical protein